jgi:hypothetical protein
MKLFECQNCRQPLYFENTRCEHCGLRLGYLPDQEVVTALHQADGDAWCSLAGPDRLFSARTRDKTTSRSQQGQTGVAYVDA